MENSAAVVCVQDGLIVYAPARPLDNVPEGMRMNRNTSVLKERVCMAQVLSEFVNSGNVTIGRHPPRRMRYGIAWIIAIYFIETAVVNVDPNLLGRTIVARPTASASVNFYNVFVAFGGGKV
jgi:hypothetical protein